MESTLTTAADLKWAARLLNTSGTVGVVTQRHRSKPHRYPRITIKAGAGRRKDLIRFASIVETGSMGADGSMTVWRCYGHTSVQRVYALLAPHLTRQRRARFAQVLSAST